MNFVVTGGTGFIGNQIAQHLVKNNHSVTVIDNFHTGKIESLANVQNKIKVLKVDILDYDELRNTVKNANGVFHEAALTLVQDSLTKQKEYYDVNVVGTENVFKLAKEFGFKVVYASSSSVYGNTKKIPIKEDFKRKPLNPYGNTKLDAEYLAEKYSKLGIHLIGLRYFNVYGPRQNVAYAGVITKFLENIANHKAPVINGDGLQVRDFVYVGDVAKVNLMAMESKVNFAFVNIGTGITVSINALADMIIKASGLAIKPVHGPPLKGDVRDSQAEISLAKKLFGWQPETKLKDWLNETVQQIMKN